MRAIELFAGAGGLGMGVSLAGFKPELVVEWDRWCCDTLRENRKIRNSVISSWPRPVEGDVRAVDFRVFENKIDLVTGGPPCQPFSIGGAHRAHDDSRDMWPEAVRAIREVRPRAFIFENVKGLTRQSFAAYLGHILLQLQYPSIERRHDESWQDHRDRLQRHHTSGGTIEYRVIPQLINAANYGVPQKRERVVFVGFVEGIDADWCFPRETHSLDALLHDQFGSGEYWERHRVASKDRVINERYKARGERLAEKPTEQAWRTVRDALQGLPEPHARDGETGIHNHRLQAGARGYVGHTGSSLDEPAKTLKAGVHGVPGGENMLRRADGSVRYFTIRESARLQAFPDNYVLHGAWSEAMRQLGNAVPVTLGEVVAKSVRAHLAASMTQPGRA
ncbi:DNA (cytosine-5)-methyltransferase 1 [Rhizobium sp. BK077]|uniref:DNA cytosine methyltransferase n=1 Tax=unclassified Rhizobium TaxID=2613769 RepID=UPI0016221399|nr:MULTISPECIES: DNA cytosine methyltransferase [unclassified Rhizobium]MBB3302478.1 DNA (cytosine-5)-methyltransferase 1 [Rhizobium sp. BK112]MBB3372151.1 DNA (cytosine-5)-methyltransferase 1 [Rhizobium sp. BK077]MBB4182580.1 DNA (cytosine-5)-methyltransferase 1 [Rhizobium sp. BK109]